MEYNSDKPDKSAMRYGKKIKLDLTLHETTNSNSTDRYTCNDQAKLDDKATKEDSHICSIPEPVQLRAVLNDKYYRPLETVDVFTCQINDKTETSRLLGEINEAYDLNELKHLKRIGNEGGQLKIIITRAREDVSCQSTTLKELFSGTFVDTKGLSEPLLTPVPKNPPLTRHQYEQWSKIWPTTFHENKHITKLMNGETFKQVELEEMKGLMREAIDAALIGKKKGMTPIGAVIVNPKTKQLLSKAHDLSLEHPLQHAAMVCIDLVGRLQRGGAWDIKMDIKIDTKDGRLVTNQDKTKRCTVVEEKCTQSCFNRENENGIADNRNISCVDNLNACWDKSTLWWSGASKNESDNKKKSSFVGMAECSGCDDTGPYLCTGYDLYITREPCVMCSMALLHSRIHRVFYAQEFASFGGLGSKHKIHCLEGTNHHFEVFSGLLETECRRLLS